MRQAYVTIPIEYRTDADRESLLWHIEHLPNRIVHHMGQSGPGAKNEGPEYYFWVGTAERGEAFFVAMGVRDKKRYIQLTTPVSRAGPSASLADSSIFVLQRMPPPVRQSCLKTECCSSLSVPASASLSCPHIRDSFLYVTWP
jgi:hypothetical protein